MTRPQSTSDYLQQRNVADANRRRNRIIAGGVIAATMPFYCAGIILWVLAPTNPLAAPTATPLPSSTPTDLPAITQQATNTLIPTNTPLPSAIPPTQGFGVPATFTPQFTLTQTPTVTPTRTQTPTPTHTFTPTVTPTDTTTFTPTVSPTPIPFGES